VAREIFYIIQHGVGVEASVSLGRVVVGWKHSKSTGETLREKVVVRQFAQANDRISGGDSGALDTAETEYVLELKIEVEERNIAQNGQGPLLFGDVAGQPKPPCYTEGILCSIPADGSHRIHFRYQRDHQRILVKLST